MDETAEFVTRNAIQVHGGKGYRTYLLPERYYRGVRILSIIGGTTVVSEAVGQ